MHSTSTHQPRRRTPRRGFTLVELMVVVTILGILAAVSIPMYSSYVYKSKASEAVGFLAEIKGRQEAYRADFGEYCNATADMSNLNPPGTPGAEQRAWAAGTDFDQLGVRPPGGFLYFSYGSFAGAPGTDPSAVLSDGRGYDGTDFWFVSVAVGDLNGDGTKVTFESYSHSQNLFIGNEDGTPNAAGWD